MKLTNSLLMVMSITLLSGCVTTGETVTTRSEPFLGMWSSEQVIQKQTPGKRGVGTSTCYEFTDTGFTRNGYPPYESNGTYQIAGKQGAAYQLKIKEKVTTPASFSGISTKNMEIIVKGEQLVIDGQVYKQGC